MKHAPLLVGLDIGTTKIVCLVAEQRADGIEIIGVGTSQSRGMKRGVVIDIAAVIQAITKAVQEAETMCGRRVESVFTGISGSHIMGMDEHGMIVIHGEITEADIRRVVEAAQAVNIPPEREIIYIEPQEFKVDDQSGIREPVGMTGKRLEARVHIITAAVSNAMNLTRCCNSVGLDVHDIVLQPMASAAAVLHPDERELGVCLVDIGGGTTDVAVYSGGALHQTHVIDIAGNLFTNDLAIGLGTSKAVAQKIKEKEGCVHYKLLNQDEEVEVPDVLGETSKKVSRKVLVDILGPRAVELLSMVRLSLEQSGWINKIPNGIVLTGGGSQIQGLTELATEIFELPVRKGTPAGVTGLADIVRNPMYATGVGLLIQGSQNDADYRLQNSSEANFGGVFERMKSWFADIFN